MCARFHSGNAGFVRWVAVAMFHCSIIWLPGISSGFVLQKSSAFTPHLDVLAPPQATSPSSNGSDMSCWNMTANPVWDQRLYEPTADFSGLLPSPLQVNLVLMALPALISAVLGPPPYENDPEVQAGFYSFTAHAQHLPLRLVLQGLVTSKGGVGSFVMLGLRLLFGRQTLTSSLVGFPLLPTKQWKCQRRNSRTEICAGPGSLGCLCDACGPRPAELLLLVLAASCRNKRPMFSLSLCLLTGVSPLRLRCGHWALARPGEEIALRTQHRC
ncbi:hypothetical protein FQA47_020409 [Oryzias melastigma]|uniref:Uncharacterized protein n=1 Tax=Oryzias melastigma TaxID=30732 RepID=A0A834FL38_ORYME|nr:hypothetical protein FQA47_020409 [Oryzias melastigma]